MVPRRSRLLAFVIATVIPTLAQAQSGAWPEGGLQFGVGISALRGTGTFGAMAALSRAWGPVVGLFGGELRITNPPDSSGMARYNPLTGRTYCGSRVIDPKSQNCRASFGSEGDFIGELGVVFSPLLPMTLSAGVRSGFVSEPYLAASVFGTTPKDGMNWIARVASGRKHTLVSIGLLLEFGVGR